MRLHQLPGLLLGLGLALIAAALFAPPPVLVGVAFAAAYLYATREDRQ